MLIIKNSLKTILVSLFILSLVSIAYAWTEPSSTPPNPSGELTPINTSSNPQIKAGSLILGNTNPDSPSLELESFGNRYGYFDNYYGTLRYVTQNSSGESAKLVVGNDGSVGIGTTAPGYKLDVNGSLNASNIYQSGLQVQNRVSGACAPGSSIRAIAANGTVTCEPDDAGGASVTKSPTIYQCPSIVGTASSKSTGAICKSDCSGQLSTSSVCITTKSDGDSCNQPSNNSCSFIGYLVQ